mgnify:CR=1 FL=1
MTRDGGAEGASLGPADKHSRHVPVLISEVLETLQPRNGETYVDGTFGAGGYSRAILEKADCVVLALDRDPNAVRGAASLVAQFPDRLKSRGAASRQADRRRRSRYRRFFHAAR